MKHGEGKEAARLMYVEQQMTFDEIAAAIGRSDKTVRTWAETENWKSARIDLMDKKVKTHEKLYNLVNNIADKLNRDCESDTQPSAHSLHALNNLVRTIKDLYTYETSLKKHADENKPRQAEGLTPETLEKLEQQMGML